jgi:periplasmic divalent cation tolerance protein
MKDELMIGWTTVAKKAEAETLAEGIIQNNLAGCVQIEGELISHYKWKGALCRNAEYRLWVKFSGSKAALLEAFIKDHHPYELPQWIVIRADSVEQKYKNWVTGS